MCAARPAQAAVSFPSVAIKTLCAAFAIKNVESATHRTAAQERDIFYNNAARFLRLSDKEIAAHDGRQPWIDRGFAGIGGRNGAIEVYSCSPNDRSHRSDRLARERFRIRHLDSSQERLARAGNSRREL